MSIEKNKNFAFVRIVPPCFAVLHGEKSDTIFGFVCPNPKHCAKNEPPGGFFAAQLRCVSLRKTELIRCHAECSSEAAASEASTERPKAGTMPGLSAALPYISTIVLIILHCLPAPDKIMGIKTTKCVSHKNSTLKTHGWLLVRWSAFQYNTCMPRITKIYTRTGDDGTTALGTTRRVSKDDLRIEAYGTVDELNAMLGLALSYGLDQKLAEAVPNIQNELLHLGSDMAFPPEDKKKFNVPRIEERHIEAMEKLIDELNEIVGPLKNFILPGGSQGAAALQVARTICRRAERRAVSLANEQEVNPLNLHYLNRLSDALFVMGRYENKQKDIEEPLWDSHA
jgi:cob(I)alamin adenosyltransferase